MQPSRAPGPEGGSEGAAPRGIARARCLRSCHLFRPDFRPKKKVCAWKTEGWKPWIFRRRQLANIPKSRITWRLNARAACCKTLGVERAPSRRACATDVPLLREVEGSPSRCMEHHEGRSATGDTVQSLNPVRGGSAATSYVYTVGTNCREPVAAGRAAERVGS